MDDNQLFYISFFNLYTAFSILLPHPVTLHKSNSYCKLTQSGPPLFKDVTHSCLSVGSLVQNSGTSVSSVPLPSSRMNIATCKRTKCFRQLKSELWNTTLSNKLRVVLWIERAGFQEWAGSLCRVAAWAYRSSPYTGV